MQISGHPAMVMRISYLHPTLDKGPSQAVAYSVLNHGA